MSNTIYCQKLKKEGQRLNTPPFPGEMGQKIINAISAEGWDAWLSHQTMLINEYRLNMLDSKARAFLKEEMEKFLFGEGSDKPEGYIPTQEEHR
jgi:Fe-S cluster biosynthesis and repair protein YggX